MCRISIIILSYNSQDTIIDTLLSAIYQSYPAHEIIISDDCSMDDTLDIVKKKIKELNRSIKVYRNEVNLGVTKNANHAATLASGDYIKFIGADDILDFHYIKEMQKAISACSKRADILYSKLLKFTSNQLVYDMDTKGIAVKTESPSYNYIMGELANTSNIKAQLKIDYEFTPSLLINKDYFFDVGGYNENYTMFEDLPFYIKSIVHRANFIFIDKELVFYRQGGTGITSSGSKYINPKFLEELLSFFKMEYKKVLFDNKLYYRYYTLKSRYWRDSIIVKYGNKRGLLFNVTKIIFLMDPQMLKKISIKYRKRGNVHANH